MPVDRTMAYEKPMMAKPDGSHVMGDSTCNTKVCPACGADLSSKLTEAPGTYGSFSYEIE